VAHQRTPSAEVDLDEIWLHAAKRSGSLQIADRAVESIIDRFPILSRQPKAGRNRPDIGPGVRSLSAGNYVILYREHDGDILVLRVMHGRRSMQGIAIG